MIHAQARLRVVTALSVLGEDDRVTFPWLKDLLSMSAGNLSVHLRKLDEAEYVEITKTFQGRTPVTFVRLTMRGRLAFEQYVTALQRLLDAGHTNTQRKARDST
ncbi:winged helix-turn-helix domain-containing protein [Sphaerimonospora sp. CA-214678]|uniref:winged helix-turn-helix domain-containing protein n=1 Tax=Sphaerimonospora sp. CA-214678 TaxID=3240029 RepID=UPI003D8BC9FE